MIRVQELLSEQISGGPPAKVEMEVLTEGQKVVNQPEKEIGSMTMARRPKAPMEGEGARRALLMVVRRQTQRRRTARGRMAGTLTIATGNSFVSLGAARLMAVRRFVPIIGLMLANGAAGTTAVSTAKTPPRQEEATQRDQQAMMQAVDRGDVGAHVRPQRW